MKLLTLNCHSWQEENQLQKIKYLAEIINEKKYDVIALQEVSQSIEAPYIYENIKEDNFAFILLKNLEQLGCRDYSLVWDFAHIGYEKYEEGLAILTKHPIIKKHSFYVSKNQNPLFWKTRKIVGATIRWHGRPLSFYSCHLGCMMKKNLSAISLIHFLKKLNMKTLSSSWAILITTPTFVERAMIT